MLTSVGDGSMHRAQRQHPASELVHRLDVAGVQRERAMQETQENMLDAARVLSAECERAQKKCDEARARARKSRMDLDAVSNRCNAIQREVQELEARIAESEAQLRSGESKRDATVPTTTGTSLAAGVVERAEQRVAASDHARSSGRADAADISLSDYVFLAHRLQVEVEAEESSVTALRQKHQDLFSKWKSLSSDVEHLKSDHQQLEAQRQALQEEQLVLAAAKANPAHREAASIYDRFQQLQQQVTAKEEDVRQTRIETSTLTSHLLAGADQRSQTIANLRRNLLQRGTNDGSTGAGHHSHHFAQEMLRENVRRRADVANVVLSCNGEKNALRQFISVLSQRLDDATRRHYAVAKSASSTTSSAHRLLS